MLELTPSDAEKFITNALKIRKIPYLAGPAGIGKSDLNFQIADIFNLYPLDIRLSQKLPEDLTGMPSVDKTTGKATSVPFDTFPMEGDKIPDGYDGWLVFLDELSSASAEVWAAIYSLLLGHTVGGMKLHEKALIVAAGNRASDSAIARELPDTLITRLQVAHMKACPKDWLKWAAKPVNNINSAVKDFIDKNPDMLMSLIPSSSREELESYGTPRGWSSVSKLAHLHEKNTGGVSLKEDLSKSQQQHKMIPEDIAHNIYASVGFMEGKAFVEFYNEHMTIPYPWEVAQSASSIRIPTSAIARAELTEVLAKHFMESGAQSREALLLYMNRNDAEARSLFCTLIKQELGETVSDLALIEDINKRLMVPPPPESGTLTGRMTRIEPEPQYISYTWDQMRIHLDVPGNIQQATHARQ